MRDYLSRKTLVPAHRKFPHGRMAIVGRLVMLSVCMLVFGVMSTQAQTGQDSRCAGYSGQAHGLCTAAVANGCFDGVQSPDCDALTANWNERCRVCAGPAPWEGCPCDFSAAKASEIGITASAQCEGFRAPEDIFIYWIQQVFDRVTGDTSSFSVAQDALGAPETAPACTIVNRGAFAGGVEGLTELQTAACVAAIKAVAVSLGAAPCPLPPDFLFK